MDILNEHLIIILSAGTVIVLAVFLYNKIKTPKSIFTQSTNHVEIRSWRLK